MKVNWIVLISSAAFLLNAKAPYYVNFMEREITSSYSQMIGNNQKNKRPVSFSGPGSFTQDSGGGRQESAVTR